MTKPSTDTILVSVMKLLTKNSDYAIRALLVLAANKDSYLSARDIAKKQDIPYQFLRRILQELIKKKLVLSKEGGKGGFKLNKNPASINIVDIIKIFQGEIQFSECVFRKQVCCNKSTCVLRKEIKRIEKVIDKEFRGVSIAKLLKNTKKGTRR